MSERTTGVLVGGIIALIGALMGFWIGMVILAAAGQMFAGILTPVTGAVFAWLVFIGSVIVLIFSILLLMGKSMKLSAIIVLIGGIISILVIFTPLNVLYILPGLLELIGAIIAMATGAMA